MTIDESFLRKTLTAEIRLLADQGTQDFLRFTDEELSKLSIDELNQLVRRLEYLVRSLGGAKGGTR